MSNRSTSLHTTKIDLSAGEFFWRLPRHARAWCLKNFVVVVVVDVVVVVVVVVVVIGAAAHWDLRSFKIAMVFPVAHMPKGL